MAGTTHELLESIRDGNHAELNGFTNSLLPSSSHELRPLSNASSQSSYQANLKLSTSDELTSTLDFSHILHPSRVDELVAGWLAEDTPSFDYGGGVVGNEMEKAVVLCKSSGVLCGAPFVDAVFRKLGCMVDWQVAEGTHIQASKDSVVTVAVVTGQARRILLGERVSLNCLARASGVASIAQRVNRVKRELGWQGCIAGTRKTTPGFRMVEKYSLLVGGCDTHRYDLSSMVMLKDNHIWSVGSITSAVQKARAACGFATKVEVECRSIAEAEEACSSGADVVMLDNFSTQILESSAAQIKSSFPHVLIEASGGVDETNLRNYLTASIDVVSMGRLTQGYDVVDFSMKILKDGHDPSNPTVEC